MPSYQMSVLNKPLSKSDGNKPAKQPGGKRRMSDDEDNEEDEDEELASQDEDMAGDLVCPQSLRARCVSLHSGVLVYAACPMPH